MLGQSQPRVSRHLRLLSDTQLLHRRREGTNAYYRRASNPVAEALFAAITAVANEDDPILAGDRRRLARVRADRAQLAARSWERIEAETALVGPVSAADGAVEATMSQLVGVAPVGRLLDIGTGSGRMLQLFGPQAELGIGIELSRDMVHLARSAVDQPDLRHCAVRYGDVQHLDAGIGQVDLAVLHHVLHFLDDPAVAIDQAGLAVVPGGRLLIVDYAPHHLDELLDHGHRQLGLDHDDVVAWCDAAGLDVTASAQLPPPGDTTPDTGLTVVVWLAERRGGELALAVTGSSTSTPGATPVASAEPEVPHRS